MSVCLVFKNEEKDKWATLKVQAVKIKDVKVYKILGLRFCLTVYDSRLPARLACNRCFDFVDCVMTGIGLMAGATTSKVVGKNTVRVRLSHPGHNTIIPTIVLYVPIR